MVVLVMSVTALILFSFGFCLGVWAYAHVHAHFFVKAESVYQRKLALAMGAKRVADEKVSEVKKRMVDQWGPDLSLKHQEVIDEEVERVLSATSGRKR